MRRLLVFLVAMVALVALFPSPASLQQGPAPRFVEQRGGFDISGPYDVDPNWPKKTWPAPGYIWGSQSGVYPYCGTFGATIWVAYICQTSGTTPPTCDPQEEQACWDMGGN